MYFNDSCDSFKSCASSDTSGSSFSDVISIDSQLRQEFSDNRTKIFRVCHINAQSVPAHYSELLTTFSSDVVDAILISESWLKTSLASTSYSLPGYVLIRNDRTGRAGGGVAIYLRADLSYKVLLSSPSLYSASPEYLFLEVSICNIKILLGVVYCPPTINYFNKVEEILDRTISDYPHNIIMGDFNTCLLSSNDYNKTRAEKFLGIIKSVNLSILPLNPTHHLASTDTLLDLILTSSPKFISTHGQIPAPGFSHHDLIYAAYKMKTPKRRSQSCLSRNFFGINQENLHADASKINWSPLMTASNIDYKVEILNKNILDLYDAHAPLRLIKTKRDPTPWIGDDIREAMKRRDKSYLKYRRSRSDASLISFKLARNNCNKMVRDAKRRFFYENINGKASAKIWSFLNNNGLGRQRKEVKLNQITVDDLVKHFMSVPVLETSVKQNTLSEIDSMQRHMSETFYFEKVNNDNVKKTISAVTSKSVGPDSIGRRMIVPILDILLPIITHIINHSLSTSQFPYQWRCAYIIPLPKVPSPALPGDFRPISILPFLSKILESIVHKQLSQFLHNNKLLNPYQSGFRPGHSTATALVKVTEDIRCSMEETKVTILVLIDFSNAFNAVDQDLLLAVLRCFSCPDVVAWFASYLHDRRQQVRVDQSVSQWRVNATGVPQGGILSPLLFSLFIDLITKSLNCQYHLYADDLQLYLHTDLTGLNSAITRLNEDLSCIFAWTSRFGVTVNPSKCQSIIVGSTRLMARLDLSSVINIEYNSIKIPFVKEVKNLGLIIDSGLTWRKQVAEVSRKVYASLHYLNKLKYLLPIQAKIMLAQALILPIIDYGDVCYPDITRDQSEKLERLLNSCIRFIFNLRKYDHVSEYRQKIKWLTLTERRKFRTLCFLFSILYEPYTPSYLKSRFSFLGSTHCRSLRSSDNLTLATPSHSTDFVANSFTVMAGKFWNDLPQSIRQAPNRPIFKNLLRRYLVGVKVD